MLPADVVLASENAQFGQPELLLGRLHPSELAARLKLAEEA